MLLLFIGSGCAALIYEIVWYQSLELIVGSSAISIGVVLGTFMGGMCVGSLLLPRYVKPDEHPLRVYAKLESGIAVCGLVILFVLPYAGGLYTSFGGSGFGGLLLRGLFCAICLAPPTLLMGATLPAVARWVQATPRGVSWLGFFYGGNIAGAVVGCLFAGFYLLRLYDVAVATYVAMALNVAVALAGLALARVTTYKPAAVESSAPTIDIPRHAVPVLVAIALSGATALGAEVVWTRLLTLLLGATTYTFSLILAAVLVGLGIGSSCGSFFARTVRNARRALGWCQLGIVVSIAWAAYCETRALPYWPVTRVFRQANGSSSRSISCAASLRCFRHRCCGARAFHWLSPPPLPTSATQAGSSARCTQRTLLVRLSARWWRASSWWAPSAHSSHSAC